MMTYEERQQYRQLREEVDALRERIDAGDPDEPLTRAEALEILSLVDAAIDRMSPERWDRALEAIVTEAARRAGASSGFRSE